MTTRAEGSKARAEQLLGAGTSPLLQLGLLTECYILSKDGAHVLLAHPADPADIELPRQAHQAITKRQVSLTLSELGKKQMVVTFSPILVGKRTIAILALAIPIEFMTRSLNSHAADKSEQTFAFDANGRLGTFRPNDSSTAIPPGALRMARGKLQPQKEADQAGEHVAKDGQRFLAAWRWLDEYDLGVATMIPTKVAYHSIDLLRQSFLILVTLVGAALLGFIALGRWTLRVRQESVLMTRRLSRLARAIQPLSAALEHDPSAVLLVDNEGSVVYANAASHRVLGVNIPLLSQNVEAVFEGLPHELQAALVSGQDSIVAKGNDSMDETLLVSSRNISIDGAPHALYMLRPITQQVRRQEVEHWKKLIRVLSHELNNALAPIASLLSSARKVNQMTHQDPRLGKIFESIADRTSHLITFLEGYREVARLPRPAIKEVDWNDFLTGLASQKRFQHKTPTPNVPGTFDPIQIERVMINLLNNAYEAESAAEDVEIEVSEESDGFRVDIMDRGTGMPEPVLKQAMLPFFSTKRTGTGVGLALSREIIEAHGGQLTLANREGGGLIVSCFLPNHALAPSRNSSGRWMASSMIPALPKVSEGSVKGDSAGNGKTGDESGNE
jgi:signal transduction histidine kinase